MLKKIKSLFLVSFLTVCLVSPVLADVKDAANLAMDKLEALSVKMEKAEQVLATIEKHIERLKAGLMGPEDLLGFDDMIKSINVEDIEKIKRGEFAKIKVPDYLSGFVTELKKDLANDVIAEKYIPTYTGENDSVVAKEKSRQRQELLHNVVSGMYASALSTRTNLKKERELPPATVEQENTRQLLEAIRSYNERYDRFVANVNKMQSGLTEYEGTLHETGTPKYVSEDGEAEK